MIMTLTRDMYRPDGIFGELHDEDANRIAVTLEHAFQDMYVNYLPKIPKGTYTCVRGLHRLNGMRGDFETFEVTGVAGHSGLLFHWGNYQSDSSGCILLGEQINGEEGHDMVTNSRATFAKFMALLKGIDSFELLVQ